MVCMKVYNHARRLIDGIAFAAGVALVLGSIAAATPAKARHVAAPRAATTSFNFSNMPVRSALQVLAEEGGFNLVVSDSVQGTITLHLDDVTWQEAFDIVLRLKGLQQRVDATTLSVTSAHR